MQQAEEKGTSATGTTPRKFWVINDEQLFAVMPGVQVDGALREASNILAACHDLAIDLSENDQRAYGLWCLLQLAKAMVDSSIGANSPHSLD